ncbi:MAG: class II aldolase and adducin N-terminal domain-containing protein [Luminiphilus sp.]|nr:class II aldolase and adducin N-terminal domain-containing protein [Luminiphilus sp.]
MRGTVETLKTDRDLESRRQDMAAAFRWTARLNMNEAVANHFSLAVDATGSQFLMNPNQVHFGRIKASDLILLDANDPSSMKGPDAPDPTAWGLHGSIHRLCPHARCLMHVHSKAATVLATLADSTLPPIDQNSAMFYERHIVDTEYGGLAFEAEGVRCAGLLTNPKIRIMVMGNHGVLALGQNVADTFFQLYYFERAAQTYISALQTGQPLRILDENIARKTADELAAYPDSADCYLRDIKLILDEEGSTYRL